MSKIIYIGVCVNSNKVIQVSLTNSYGQWTISLPLKNLVSPEFLVFMLYILPSDAHASWFSNTKQGSHIGGKGSRFGRCPLGGRRWSQTACPRNPYPCSTLCSWGSTTAGEASPLTSDESRPQERKRKLVSVLRKIRSRLLSLATDILTAIIIDQMTR